MQEQNMVAGLWKFSNKVPREELVKVAAEWAKNPKYTHLYVRKMSKDQHGIGFEYMLEGEEATKEKHDAYMYETSDILKRKFGNDLAGWDTACPVVVVK